MKTQTLQEDGKLVSLKYTHRNHMTTYYVNVLKPNGPLRAFNLGLGHLLGYRKLSQLHD